MGQLANRQISRFFYGCYFYQSILLQGENKGYFKIVTAAEFFCRYQVFFLHVNYFNDSFFDSCRNNSFCSSVKLVGNLTVKVTNRSPYSVSFLYKGKPLPFNRTFVPFCVSGFTFNFIFPLRVSIVISPPSTAVYRSISIVV